MYRISAHINGKFVELTCDHESAKVLLPHFVSLDEHGTTCLDLESRYHVVCFIEDSGNYDGPPYDAATKTGMYDHW